MVLFSLTSAVLGQEQLNGWRLADRGYELTFPKDHAAHPEYRIEWWYYTGNLETSQGHRFGYQLTFFRVGIDRQPQNLSTWAVRDLHMAHFAITDIDRGLHRVAEKLNRAGVGWAGASTETLHVWNEEWSATLDGNLHRLQASNTDTFGQLVLDLHLNGAEVLPVRHGDDGFSQKGQQNGNASHYYSYTRLETTGRLVIDGEAFEVAGLSWMDHEFGSSFLEQSQVGWDWFSIQLNDGTDLMVYTLRLLDGTLDSRSSGTLVTRDGITRIGFDEFQITPGRHWASPTSGAVYPVSWRVEVPKLGLALNVTAALDAQELVTAKSTGVTYWEGTINIHGTRNNVPVYGRGYLEMTGYAGPPMSTVLR